MHQQRDDGRDDQYSGEGRSALEQAVAAVHEQALT
jgi:hypothetical protein